ncbi:DinB family protein [Deinococcus hopiensis]|uniref:DinB superfamily protein n=1 Tax=Deinococcus hopiensis KR-140 TaxID=695939 RepID=A0A1W1UZN6_9DEIO|nr:DinB family protein [Deinococcus hopiensis]SMB86221.1 DinB superfamily protein [Deinococcus hopiensis KR-140]
MPLLSPLDLEVIAAELRSYSEPAVNHSPAAGKWSAKEILGHLMDSAVNNHVRFIRAQAENPLHIPGYDQEHWNRCQAYQQVSWLELINLWLAYNLHIRRVLDLIPEATLGNMLVIGDGPRVTLQFVAEDYYEHLQHHIDQIRALNQT